MKRFDGHVWNGSTVAFFGGRIPFCSWWRFFFWRRWLFLTLPLVQSDLILGTLASFGSKYTAGGFFAWSGPKMHTWFCFCFGFIFGLDFSLWTSCCLWSSWSSLSKTQVCMLRAKQSMETIPWSGPGQFRRESPSAFPAMGAERALPWAPCPASGWLLLSTFKGFFRCSLAHLHLVDGAPVLGVLDLGVGRVDDLVVVVKQLLADRALGVEVLRIRKILIIQLQLCAQINICWMHFFLHFCSTICLYLVGGLGKAVLLQLTLDLRKKTSTKDQGQTCLRFYKFFPVF